MWLCQTPTRQVDCPCWAKSEAGFTTSRSHGDFAGTIDRSQWAIPIDSSDKGRVTYAASAYRDRHPHPRTHVDSTSREDTSENVLKNIFVPVLLVYVFVRSKRKRLVNMQKCANKFASRSKKTVELKAVNLQTLLRLCTCIFVNRSYNVVPAIKNWIIHKVWPHYYNNLPV